MAQPSSTSFLASRAVAIVGGLVVLAGALIIAFPGHSPGGVIEVFVGLPIVSLGIAIFGASCLIDWDERPRAARILGVILFPTGILTIAAVIVRWCIVAGCWQ